MYQVARKLFFTDCRCAEDASKTYEDLFAKLDSNKDGRVDVSELKAGLAAMGIKTARGAAQVESCMLPAAHMIALQGEKVSTNTHRGAQARQGLTKRTQSSSVLK